MLQSRTIRKKFGATATHNERLGQVIFRACLLPLAVGLGSCSASEMVQNWTSTPATPLAPDLSQPNYRRVVADNIKAIFPNSASLDDLEISEVRLVDHVKGPAWITCLRFNMQIKPTAAQPAPSSTTAEDPGAAPAEPGSTNRTGPHYYAIFIQDNKIIDSRFSVAIDKCRSQAFQPFDPATSPAARKG
jgi:hypothetical protein